MDSKTISFKAKVMTPAGIEEGVVTISNGIITDVRQSTLTSEEVVDLGDAYIVPGYIDMHIHGVHHYLIDNGIDDLAAICRYITHYGTTSFLPTVAPRAKVKDAEFLASIAKISSEGAEVLGFHLEGPFLKLTGSLPPEAVSQADPERATALIEAAKPYKAVFSISPDIENITDIIPLMTTGNTPVFMTHTAANVEQTEAAIAAGARHATHFYDVFPCPDVREPGVRPCGIVEAVLADPRVSVDFILDGVHVEPVAVKLALAAKSQGPGTVCLITDANVGAGLEPGKFIFGNSGEIEFEYKGAPARKVSDKTLAGSGLTMEQAVKNAISMLGVDLHQAVTMASTNPAKVLGVDHRKGKIQAGYDADLVILDKDYNVLQTWVAGVCRFDRETNKAKDLYEQI